MLMHRAGVHYICVPHSKHAFEYFTETYPEYLSAVKCSPTIIAPHSGTQVAMGRSLSSHPRRVFSRLRTGCHGLQVDTNR